jgi:hypothetical protein
MVPGSAAISQDFNFVLRPTELDSDGSLRFRILLQSLTQSVQIASSRALSLSFGGAAFFLSLDIRFGKGIVVHDLGQRLRSRNKLAPCVSLRRGRQSGIKLRECPAGAEFYHRGSKLIEREPEALEPRQKRHTATGADGVLIAAISFADVIGHSLLRPRWRGGEVCESVVADHGSTPTGKRLAGVLTA